MWGGDDAQDLQGCCCLLEEGFEGAVKGAKRIAKVAPMMGRSEKACQPTVIVSFDAQENCSRWR
jgi:hypothetical protein